MAPIVTFSGSHWISRSCLRCQIGQKEPRKLFLQCKPNLWSRVATTSNSHLNAIHWVRQSVQFSLVWLGLAWFSWVKLSSIQPATSICLSSCSSLLLWYRLVSFLGFRVGGFCCELPSQTEVARLGLHLHSVELIQEQLVSGAQVLFLKLALCDTLCQRLPCVAHLSDLMIFCLCVCLGLCFPILTKPKPKPKLIPFHLFLLSSVFCPTETTLLNWIRFLLLKSKSQIKSKLNETTIEVLFVPLFAQLCCSLSISLYLSLSLSAFPSLPSVLVSSLPSQSRR